MNHRSAENTFGKGVDDIFDSDPPNKVGIEGTNLSIIKVIYDKPSANIILRGEKLEEELWEDGESSSTVSGPTGPNQVTVVQGLCSCILRELWAGGYPAVSRAKVSVPGGCRFTAENN